MKSWVCRRFADPIDLAIEELQGRLPEDDEVQVAIHAAGVHFAEKLMLTGTYQVRAELPYIPGGECSGVVVRCGKRVTRIKVGDRVMVFNGIGGGAYSEEITVPATSVFSIPPTMSLVEAASFPANYTTSYYSLVHRGQLRRGEVLVVHGSTGGVGLAAVQIGRALGATVIATGSDDNKLAIVSKQGAHHVINYRSQPIRDRVLELTNGRGADVYLDPVGGDLFDSSMRAIAPEGRILVVGFTSGRFANAPTNIVLVKGISILGANLLTYTRDHPVESRQLTEDVLSLVAQGKFKPFVHRTFDFPEALAALQSIADRQVIGKYVLVTEREKKSS